MKKKDIITVIIIALILAAILFGAIFLASRHMNIKEDQSKAICFCHPDFNNSIFFSEKGKIYEYDTETGELRVLIESGKVEGYIDHYEYMVDQVYKGKLFYHYFSDYNQVMNFSYYNLLNGETRFIGSVKCAHKYEKVIIYEGYIYCVYCTDDNRESDVLRISRFNIDNGDEQILYESASKDEFLVAVTDRKIITRQEHDNLFSYNIGNMKKSLLWSAESNGYKNLFTGSIIENKLYFTATTGVYSVKPEPDSYWIFADRNPNKYLLCLDINTGKFERVLDIQISTYCLTENAIYYSPMAVRGLAEKNTYKASIEEVSFTDETLFACDLDGRNIREIYTNKDTFFGNIKILNGKVYCNLGLFNYENESFDFYEYTEIDLSTKEIKIIEIPN